MNNMFSFCISLKLLDLSSFNTYNAAYNVTNMSYMFDGCKTLESLGLCESLKIDKIKFSKNEKKLLDEFKKSN